MKNTMILLAGYPATGKSYLCSIIQKRYPQFELVSQDDLKEKLWDEYGFDNLEEKSALEMRSWNLFYDILDRKMENNKMLISDYPFSDKQKHRLGALALKNKYQIITIRLVGDIDTLYQRSRKRDLNPDRHLGHLVSRYHKGDQLENRGGADCIVTYDIFNERCKKRGYDRFELGHLIQIDVTDYEIIDYSLILDEICGLL